LTDIRLSNADDCESAEAGSKASQKADEWFRQVKDIQHDLNCSDAHVLTVPMRTRMIEACLAAG
jgi:hypothetical protein